MHSEITIIPTPKTINVLDKKVIIIKPCIYSHNLEWQPLTVVFSDYIRRIFDTELENGVGGIELIHDSNIRNANYTLDISDGVKIYASDYEGAAWALSTVLQIISFDNNEFSLSALNIEDGPDKDYRGLMVDLARQFHPFNTIFNYVDVCFFYKIKYLQLHFIDNESYTLPSKAFPLLSSPDRHYRFDEIKILVEYAKQRGVVIVPEIEVPGHARCINRAYPEIFSDKYDKTECDAQFVTEAGAVVTSNDIICAGSRECRDALKKLIEEVTQMFPYSPYIHIGGDEANINAWNLCSCCRRYMKDKKLEDVGHLYSDFIAETAQMVIDAGKTPIVWEGFPEKGSDLIPKETIVIAWESYYHTADKLVKNGFKIINCSWQPLYIVPSLIERWSPKDILNWNIYNWQHWWKESKAFSTPITVTDEDKVLGAQLCAWEQSYEMEVCLVTENLAALAERSWNTAKIADDDKFLKTITRLKAKLGKLIG